MRLKTLLSSVLLLAWLLTTILLYILVSRVSYLQNFLPPSPALLLAYLDRMSAFSWLFDLLRALGGMALFAFSALALGLRLLPHRLHAVESPLARGSLAFLLGELIFSFFFLTVIRLWQMPLWLTAAIMVLSLLIGLPALWRFLRSLPCQVVPADLLRPDRFIFLLTLVVFSLGLTLSSARLGYDAVTEYFSHAKIMAVTYQPVFLYPKDSFVVSSFHPGILFTAQIQLFGDQAARMLPWLNGAAILILLWTLGERLGLTVRARLYALLMVVTSTAFVDLLGDGKVELISIAPMVAALYWMIDGFQNPTRVRFLLIGVLLGFAIIARPYNIFLVPLFTFLFYLLQVWPVVQKEGLKAAWNLTRPVFWMLPPLLAMGAFHLWQNSLWLGSPFAPLTYARDLDIRDWQWQFDPAALNTLRLLYPLTVTFMNTPQSLGNISPLFVGILPFLLLKNVRARFNLSAGLRSLLLPALVTLALWLSLFFTVVEIRYVFFLWILLFLFGGQVLEAVFNALDASYRAILRVALAGLMVFMMIRTLLVSFVTYSPIDANGQAHCYDISFCTFLDPLNQSAAEGERVFVLNAYRYYLRPDLFACSSQAQEYAPLQALAKENSGQFWVELYRQGFRYVTYEKGFAKFHSHFGTIPPPDSAPEWLKITVISSTKNEKVYELYPLNPPVAPLTTCLKTEKGFWKIIELDTGR